MSRRDLARWSLLGAGSIPFAALIAACAKESGAGATVPPTAAPTTVAPATTLAIDPSKPWWLQANFAPVMDEGEAFLLLDRLERQATVPDVQVRFKWAPGSVAFWDNRATQHAVSNDFLPHRRLMERVTIVGDRPF